MTTIFDHPTPLALATYLSTIPRPSDTKDGDNNNPVEIHTDPFYHTSYPLASSSLALNDSRSAGVVHIVGISCRYPTPISGIKGTMEPHASNDSPSAFGS